MRKLYFKNSGAYLSYGSKSMMLIQGTIFELNSCSENTIHLSCHYSKLKKKDMNLLDAHVTKVLSEPYFKYNKWIVKVEYRCYGSTLETVLMFIEEEKAKEVKEGFTFTT